MGSMLKVKAVLAVMLAITLVGLSGCAGMVSDMINENAPQRLPKEESVKPEETVEFTTEQTRALAFGAVLSTRNDMTFKGNLFGVSDAYQKEYIGSLEEWWDIRDTESAIEALEWLKTEGHGFSNEDYYGFDDAYNYYMGRETGLPEDEEEYIAESFAVELPGIEDVRNKLISEFGYTELELDEITTLRAWDYDRLVTVARWCYGVGYITEDEAWSYINFATEQGEKDYTSWRTYLAGVIIGRTIWNESSTMESDDEEIVRDLLSSSSIYNQVSFSPLETI